MGKDQKNADAKAEFLIRLFGAAEELDTEELDMIFEGLAPDVDAKEEVQKIAQAAAARLRERGENIPAHLESALKATKKSLRKLWHRCLTQNCRRPEEAHVGHR
jgi:hypothetical protein